MHPGLTLQLATVFAIGLAVAPQASANEYPVRPVRVLTGNAGATADIVTRQLGRRLTERWGQQIVVDNRGGAAATIAAEIAANAPPDGYTLLMGQLNSHALAVNVYARLSYDPVADFAPIARVASAPQVLAVTGSIPGGNWQQFADYVRQRPGQLNYASAGHATASHLTAEFLKQAAKLDLVHVNYKGGSSAMLALAGGEAAAGFVPLATALPLAQSGKVKLLAIASLRRFPALPDVPTFDESGVRKFEAASWFGMFAPARTSPALVARLNRDIVDVLQMPSMQQDLLRQGAEAVPTTAAEFSDFVKREIAKWREVIRRAGIAPT